MPGSGQRKPRFPRCFLPRMLGAAVAGVVGALAALAAPAGARVGFDVAVIDSNAVAASVGIISRVPAESPGGLNWTATAITLDKAVAKAAGGTGGSLAETFLESSSKEYRNPSLIGAQYPPTATIPTEARGGSPAGTPGGIVATHVVATEQPAATAEAQGGRGGDGGPVVVQGGSSSSHGELRADGFVNLDEGIERRYCAVNLATSVVGDRDSVHAVLAAHPRILLGFDAFEHQLALPAFANPIEVAPVQALIGIAGGP